MASDDTTESGVRVVGTIEKIWLHTIESIFEGVPDRPVTRIELRIEKATDVLGRPFDHSNWVGLAFEASPELATAFSSGDRVEIVTTTPTGMHVARMRRAPLS